MRVFSVCAAIAVCISLLAGCRAPEIPAYDAFSCVLSDGTYSLRYTCEPSVQTMTVLSPSCIVGLTLQWRGTDCRLLYDADGTSLALPVTEAVTGGFAAFPERFRQSAETDKNGVPTAVTIRHPTRAEEKRFAVTEFSPAE